MQFFLTHARFPNFNSNSWNGRWIYVGRNYLTMKTWEQRLVGERISLKELIQKESVKQRPPILDWIARQREANDDSLHWWMTDLAGRNNMSSRFFDDIIHIAALKSWVDQNIFYQDEILVICEDSYLLATIEVNLKSRIKVRSLLGWQIILLLESGYYILRGFATLARQILHFWKHYHAARASRPSNLQTPHGEVYLIHQCLDDKALIKDGPLACRYFTVLPQWLEEQGKQVYRLPWLFNISLPLDKVYQKLRDSSCLIPEDWLTWRDYLTAFWFGFQGVFRLKKDVKYENLDLYYLMYRQQWLELQSSPTKASFYLWSFVLIHLKQISFLNYICFFEKVPAEFVQPFIWRTECQKNSSSKFFGYYHSLVTRDYLAYHNFPGETESLVFPDVIITNGNLARSVLIDQGLNPEKVRSGPALRQQFSPRASDGNYNALAVLLSLDLQAVAETLDKLSDYIDWMNDQNIAVILKPHPMSRKENILTQMKWTDLPQGWQWFDGEMVDVLKKARCCITMATSSIFDVLLLGCIALTLERELTTAWNNADLLETEFPILKSLSHRHLHQRLEEIFVTSRQRYDQEFANIRETLLAGLNPVSDSTLSLFL
ncbi:hypothetical protein GSN00_05550 [Cylindrospermopsis raciborskii CHAB3438]|uniref:hypothetical protein n=1 Tax=Cylindrospermopsis raciborskii TaxID=77022 RepID=UPI001F0FD041|nr:hypothetical protein [Cylindrospermopsis raciborskii]MCH4903864.1 hypothetical protein [Cylindrospermopsis raciborskii CHAB3438]